LERYGALIAVLEFLEATDMHSSNIVVDGDYPVPVDLECVFHLRSRPISNGPTASADEALAQTPLRTGMIPVRSPSTQPEGVDLSALGAHAQHIVRSSTVCVGGTVLDPSEHVDSITKGYKHALGVLQRHSDALVEADGILSGVHGLRVRYIHRNTAVYRRLIEAAGEQQWNASGITRSVALDRLWRTWRPNEAPEFIAHSVRALWHGDIPYFSSTVGSTLVTTDAGTEVWSGASRDSLRLVADRLKAASPLREDWAGHVLRASLESSGRGARLRLRGRRVSEHPPLSSAIEIGESLVRGALRTKRGWTWMVTKHVGDRWQIEPATAGLFDGLPGIALAFGAMFEATGDGRWAEVQHAAFATICTDWSELKARARGSGPYLGLACSALFAASTARGVDEEIRGAIVDRALSGIRHELETTTAFDFFSGLAGIIASAAASRDALNLDLANEITDAAERLIDSGVPHHETLSWKDAKGRQLVGLAHGASGAALALTIAASIDGNTGLLDAAQSACRYEAQFRDEDTGGWADLRNPNRKATIPASWCNGASGVGLSRRMLIKRFPSDCLLASELNDAQAVVRQFRLQMPDDGLCHGWFGTTDPDLGIDSSLMPAAAPPWRPAEPGQPGTAGLFLGEAGIMYAISRRLAPTSVPSVLTLTVGGA
jgi:lantibiotic modifying enzyme